MKGPYQPQDQEDYQFNKILLSRLHLLIALDLPGLA